MVYSRRYCKAILLTSLVWIIIDVIYLLAHNEVCPNCDKTKQEKSNSGGLGQLVKNVQDVLPGLPPFMMSKGPGEMGKAVIIPKEKEKEKQEKFKINQFNLLASEMISVNRSLPDVRMDGCKHKDYEGLKLKSSIVIVFHNEAWTTLLRTIHSIINRSPRHLLQEIILVDDASERDFLGKPLEDYISRLPIPVMALRMGKRSGLIRARLRGAAAVKGDVIIFLDAHCECTDGWLEPLIVEIQKDQSTVVCPIIDVISDETFEFMVGSDQTYGGFNWKLNFRWYPVPQRENDRRHNDKTLPLRTPTMAGGLFAIHTNYFEKIGTYDSGMDIWGGENLEMSFRIWQCGGTLLIATCSHVGHVFRKATPYTFPGGTGHVINKNNRRLAEVWMDEFKNFFYVISPGVLKQDYGDVTERKKLREKLQCKSFKWYLENIYPDSQIPSDYFSLGEVRNKKSGMCLDTMGRKENEKVGLFSCHGMGGNQVWAYTNNKEIRSDDICLDVSRSSGPVMMIKCHHMKGNQLWDYDKDTMLLRHPNMQKCLAKPKDNTQAPTLVTCDENDDSLRWVLKTMDVPIPG